MPKRSVCSKPLSIQIEMRHHCCLLRGKQQGVQGKGKGAEVALEMTVDIGKARVERLRVRPGEEPGAAARAFCARYKLPQRLELVLANAIEANLQQRTHTPTQNSNPTEFTGPDISSSKENITPRPFPCSNQPADMKPCPSSQSLLKPAPIPPPRPPLKPEFSQEMVHKLQQERYADIYQALKYPEDQVLLGSRVRSDLIHSDLLALLEPLLKELRDLGETLSLQEFQASMVNLTAILTNEERRVLFFPFDFQKVGAIAAKSAHARSASTMI